MGEGDLQGRLTGDCWVMNRFISDAELEYLGPWNRGRWLLPLGPIRFHDGVALVKAEYQRAKLDIPKVQLSSTAPRLGAIRRNACRAKPRNAQGYPKGKFIVRARQAYPV